jgi:predicted amidohydrolase YtcJ
VTFNKLLLTFMSVITFFLVGCSSEESISISSEGSAPDLIVINGDIYTSDRKFPRAQAFAVENGRFSAIGTNAEVKALADKSTHVIDSRGNTVTPGFIDGHSHVSGNVPLVAGVDLSYINDKNEWLKIIAEADKRMPKGEWITGGRWDHTLSDGIYPTKQMLDKVVPDRPISLQHIDGHYSWVNSLALEIAGVEENTPTPPGGKIMVDPQTGDTTGILLERAQTLVNKIIPNRSDVQRQTGLATMQKYANSFGITGLHQMGSLDDYLYIVEKGDPTLRVWYGYLGFERGEKKFDEWLIDLAAKKIEINMRVAATKKEEVVGPLLKLGYVKLMNDGVLSAHTAVLSEDYSDREGWKGEYITSPEELKEQVKLATAAGFPVAVHSIGDAAVAATLDAFEAAKGNITPFPNRIEHIEINHTEDIQRFKELGIVASMQPNHATNAIVYVPKRVGKNREARTYVWRSMLHASVPLVFGADYPTSPLSPLVQMADAIFRVSPFGFNDGKPFHPEQAVSFEDALMAYTQSGADITKWKDEIGSISVGKWADFVLLDGSVPVPMGVSFRNLSVEATYLAGKKVYSKKK